MPITTFVQPPSGGVVAWNATTGFSAVGPTMGATPLLSMPPLMPSMGSVPPGMSPAFLQALRGPFGGGEGTSAMGTGAGMNMGMGIGMGMNAGMAAGPFSPPADSRSHSSSAARNPVHPHAYVTFGAGMRQRDIDAYTAAHPLPGQNTVSGVREEHAVPYYVPMSAHPVGSSIMMLGGFGFVSRMHGLSVDNVVEVEMVLADGRVVVASEEGDPDLWWAIRGAGPAFGIATRYKVRAHPIPIVFAGNLIYRFHRATAASLIKHFRDCVKNAPRELYANVLLTAGPADKDSLVVIQMCYAGSREDGLAFLRQQDSVAQVLRGKVGRQWFLRSSLITSLPDEVINKTVLEFSNTPIGCTWIFELAGGAIEDFEDTCLPKEQRAATWTVAALHQWDMGIDDPRCIETAEEWMKRTIAPVATGGPLPTFLGRHEPASRTMASFGASWSRLAGLKARYDPDHVFRNCFWPLDARGEPLDALVNEPPSP
ncbi:uncharacterized protein BXZ73DRAFT_100528 [Epithele typhae]|uniref:uncharacterized protein n=1 Tax=Epithele typhae TaxID=378194 RepID=UPI00200760F1|nr:uncharacterized protein BXZ73DRAFT_100528 [Epithele typhae]KAH9935139.1 hypothetical protein BXZ73DRAFT_100528 [Epithele typhae]